MKLRRYLLAVAVLIVILILVIPKPLRENITASKVLTAEAGEGDNVTFKVPEGKVISKITFASYGTPSISSKGVPKKGDCHAEILSRVAQLCVGKSTCEIRAHNDSWGDPCYGTYKKIIVGYTVATGEEVTEASSKDPYASIRGANGKILFGDETEEDNTMLYVGIAGGIILLLAGIGGYIFYLRRQQPVVVAGRRR